MARWSNGEQHVVSTRHRHRAGDQPVGRRSPRANACVRAAAVELSTATDLVPVARLVPVMVLAEALGFAAPRDAAHHQRVVTLAIAPEDGSTPAADQAVEQLARLVARSQWWCDVRGGGEPNCAAAPVPRCDGSAHRARSTTVGPRNRTSPLPRSSQDVLHEEPPVVATVRMGADGAALDGVVDGSSLRCRRAPVPGGRSGRRPGRGSGRGTARVRSPSGRWPGGVRASPPPPHPPIPAPPAALTEIWSRIVAIDVRMRDQNGGGWVRGSTVGGVTGTIGRRR